MIEFVKLLLSHPKIDTSITRLVFDDEEDGNDTSYLTAADFANDHQEELKQLFEKHQNSSKKRKR